MEVLLGPMRPSVAGGRVYVPAEMRRDETNEKSKEKRKSFFGKRRYYCKKRKRRRKKNTDCVGPSLSLSI